MSERNSRGEGIDTDMSGVEKIYPKISLRTLPYAVDNENNFVDGPYPSITQSTLSSQPGGGPYDQMSIAEAKLAGIDVSGLVSHIPTAV